MRDIINKALISRTSIQTREKTRMTIRLLEDAIIDMERALDDMRQSLANVQAIEKLQTTAIERQA